MKKMGTEKLLRLYVVVSSVLIVALAAVSVWSVLTMRGMRSSMSYTEWNATQACLQVAHNCDVSDYAAK